MSLTMYQASVPVFSRALGNLAHVIGKAQAHAEAKSIDPTALIQFRLYPDMLPLVSQVRIACDMVSRGAARLAGVDLPSFEDKETTFAELLERIEKAQAFLKTLKPEQFEGSDARELSLPMRGTTMVFKGLDYLNYFVLPNLYFHCTTTYNIFRHNGVELGKMDFVGKPN